MRKATQQQTKAHNRNLVLRIFFERESISRAEIARITSLTRTTVSDILTELIDEGLVREVGIGPSQGGKSPILLSLVKDARYLIGLDLAQNQFEAAVVNLGGEVQAQVTVPVKDRSGEEALALVFEMLDKLFETPHRPLIGIGVGTPGLVNTREGIIVNAVNLGWRGLPLAGLLKDRYRLPVAILNDSQAAAVGEYTYARGEKPTENMVIIIAGHGIGSGILINGQLFQGDGGGAGEIGHIVVEPDSDVLCRCGNYGCLETVASAQALIRRANALAIMSGNSHVSSQETGFRQIVSAYEQGDPIIRQMVLETGRYLGLGIASLIGTLNINKIVLTGEMISFGQSWLEVIRQTVSQHTLKEMSRHAQVVLGGMGSNAVILGASALLSNDYSLLSQRQSLRE